jgi:hypothetical protein
VNEILFNIENALQFAEIVGQESYDKEDYNNTWRVALLIAELEVAKEKLLVLIGENK